MWEGGCGGAGGVQKKNFAGNWTIDTCLALATSSNLPWVTGFFLSNINKSCFLYGDGCNKNAGASWGPWKYYRINEVVN